METWQLFISVCAGVITLLTLFEKIRGTKSFKQLDAALATLQKVPSEIQALQNDLTIISQVQKDQTSALLAILHSDLYRCFRENRELEAWTDEEARVQTNLHEVYCLLHGNGEEALWWDRKRTWRIVSDGEYQELVQKQHEQKTCS